MEFIKENGDLFEISNEKYNNGWVLAHCISSDFSLQQGIAKEFDKRYRMSAKLKNSYTIDGKVPRSLKIGNVYNLVTKKKYWHKPTYETLRGSLEILKDQMVLNNESRLAIPLIGCGLDRLQWVKVEDIIKEVFKETEIIIKVRVKK